MAYGSELLHCAHDTRPPGPTGPTTKPISVGIILLPWFAEIFGL